jgi:hypothetical protein
MNAKETPKERLMHCVRETGECRPSKNKSVRTQKENECRGMSVERWMRKEEQQRAKKKQKNIFSPFLTFLLVPI